MYMYMLDALPLTHTHTHTLTGVRISSTFWPSMLKRMLLVSSVWFWKSALTFQSTSPTPMETLVSLFIPLDMIVLHLGTNNINMCVWFNCIRMVWKSYACVWISIVVNVTVVTVAKIGYSVQGLAAEVKDTVCLECRGRPWVHVVIAVHQCIAQASP